MADESLCFPGCLNSAVCVTNSTVCDCSTTSFETADDMVMFRVGNNCGIVVPVLITAYCVAIMFGFSIGLVSCLEARKHTRLTNRLMLISNGLGAFATAIFCIAHWLEGYRFGIYTTLVFTYALSHYCFQVGFSEFLVFAMFFRMSTRRQNRIHILKRFLTTWTIFWFWAKVIPLLVVLVSVILTENTLYNRAMLATIICVLTETISQSLMSIIVFQQLYKTLDSASNSSQLTGRAAEKRQQIEMFAKKISNQLIIIKAFLVAMFLISITILVLAIRYDGRIPYSWAFFALYIISWPSMSFGPIILYREKIMKNDTPSNMPPPTDEKSGNVENVAQIVAVPNGLVANGPVEGALVQGRIHPSNSLPDPHGHPNDRAFGISSPLLPTMDISSTPTNSAPVTVVLGTDPLQ